MPGHPDGPPRSTTADWRTGFRSCGPDLFVGRTDVQHTIAVRIDEEEHVAEVFRHLPESQLAGTQTFFGLPLCRHVQVHDYGAIRMVISQGRHRQ
jgi:hypothetical protein